MKARATCWTVGLLAVTAMATLLVSDRSGRELAIPVALIGLGVTALIAEAGSIRAQACRPARPGSPPGSRAADGVVEVVPMLEVEGEANPASPRYRKFSSLRERGGESGQVRSLPGLRQALLGNVALISVFVGRDEAGWTDEEIARGHAALERAGLWIEREAARHGAPLNIGLADAYFRVQDDEVDAVEVAFADEGDDVGPMEAHASSKSLIAASRAAASLGFSDIVDLVGRINPRVQADARVWLIHVRRSGRSLAIPAAESEIVGVGLAICFSKEASFPEPLAGPGRVDPTTIVHELLHLFGATDKYGVSLGSFPGGAVSHRDIMRLDHPHLARMTVDGLTASEVGWPVAELTSSSTKKARPRPEEGQRRAGNWPGRRD